MDLNRYTKQQLIKMIESQKNHFYETTKCYMRNMERLQNEIEELKKKWGSKNEYKSVPIIKDIMVIAKNLGFETACINLPNGFNEKTNIYMIKGDELFMQYKVYRNGNMHVKFNQEFTKALNVEVSRLLGWIRHKEDIANEFPEEIAKGAEKYFKVNMHVSLENSNLKLLSTSKGE